MFIVKIYNFTTNNTERSEVFADRAVADAIAAKMNASTSNYRHAWVEPVGSQAKPVVLPVAEVNKMIFGELMVKFSDAKFLISNTLVSVTASTKDDLLEIIKWFDASGQFDMDKLTMYNVFATVDRVAQPASGDSA